MRYYSIKIISNFILYLSFLSTLFAQQYNESWKLFDDSHVGRVDITINPAALQWIYQNVQSDSEHYAVFRFRNNWIDQTVDSVGFRLRGNTSRVSEKKSFKVSFNTFIRGRQFYGVEKLNLNGEHNDPSIIRSKLCFDHFKSIGFKASRANHVQVYINGKYYGLYISVEHIDEEFLKKTFSDNSGNLWKCLYPADLTFHGTDPLYYINLNSNGRPVYELKTNTQQNDFSKLVRFINVLNNTSASLLADSIESIIDVAGVLKYFAMNILTGSWDDYWSLMNNYYLYYEPAADLFHIIPYDYDNTYGIDWFNIDWANANPYNFPKVASGSRPLAERLLSNAQYRNLYTHFLEYFRDHVYKLSLWQNRIDSIKQMITPYALTDSFRTRDYGFTMDDFHNSYSATGYSKLHVKYGLKQFVNSRVNSLFGQLSYQASKPIVYRIYYEPKNPKPTDSIRVYVSAFSQVGLSEVSIQFTKTGSSNLIIPMVFSPVPNTKIVDEADRYIGVIHPLGVDGSGKFSIYVKDVSNQFELYPKKGAINIRVTSSVNSDVRINEFLADNKMSNQDPNGEFDDWIELINPTSSPILLTGRYLTDNPANLQKWRFTQQAFYLNPGEYLIIWCDEQLTQPGIHTNFKLSKNGEYIALVETDGITIIDSITFGAQKTDTSYGRYPDASDNWQFMLPTPGYSNNVVSNVCDNIPTEFALSQNYPNPFNPITKFEIAIPQDAKVEIVVYDILGSKIATLFDGFKVTGYHTIKWDGKNSSGNVVPSGVYFVKMTSSGFSIVRKLLMLK